MTCIAPPRYTKVPNKSPSLAYPRTRPPSSITCRLVAQAPGGAPHPIAPGAREAELRNRGMRYLGSDTNMCLARGRYYRSYVTVATLREAMNGFHERPYLAYLYSLRCQKRSANESRCITERESNGDSSIIRFPGYRDIIQAKKVLGIPHPTSY